MKSLLFAMSVGLMMIGCGEEAKKEAVQDERKLASISAEEEQKRQEAITERVKPLIEKKENFLTDNKLEMIWVEPGTFMMGDKGEQHQHQVTLTKGFYFGKHEVTQDQWERVMGSNQSRFKGADRPVENVSWNDVVAFCKKLTEMEKKAGRVPEGMAYQLPTEAQWEYACRAGTSTAYSWGDTIAKTNANYAFDGYGKGLRETTPVGSYPANLWGFHDMHGNAWEWCADWYAKYPSGSVTNPEGPASGSYRVQRGGSWDYGGAFLRSAERGNFNPSNRHTLGFRVGFQKQ